MADGSDATPKRNKARALLAVLALTPDCERARVQMQDLLWSRFADAQARRNLNGEVHLIRKHLGDAADVLQTGDGMVRLDRERVWVDLLDEPCADRTLQAIRRPEMLLENLSLDEPEFDDWLRDERQRIANLAEHAPESAVPSASAHAAPAGLSATAPRTGIAKAASSLTLLRSRNSFGEGSGMIAESLTHRIARGMTERTGIDIRKAPEPDEGISLRLEVASDQNSTNIHIVLAAGEESQLLWTKSEPTIGSPTSILSAEGTNRLINQTIDICALEFSRYNQALSGDPHGAAALDNIQGMLTLDMTELPSAQARLQSAYEDRKRPIYLAYQAYLRAFQIAELRPESADDLRAEAEELAAAAVAADPANSTLLALMSCVQSVVLRNHVIGHELAEQCLRLDATNPLGLVFLGRAKAYLGQEEEGNMLAEKALRLSGIGPARNSVCIFAAATAFLSGRYAEAIRLCEIVRAACPDYKAPLRMLIPLYARTGERGKAREVFQRLRRMEPGFSLEKLLEETYPSSGLRSSGLLEDLRAGL